MFYFSHTKTSCLKDLIMMMKAQEQENKNVGCVDYVWSLMYLAAIAIIT